MKYLSELLKNRKNLIGFIFIGVMILGIPVAVILLQQTQIFRSQANTDFIKFVGSNVQLIGTKQVAVSEQIEIEVIAPGATAGPTATPTSATPTPGGTRDPQASLDTITPINPSDSQDITVNFVVNVDVNFVNLWVDSCERWAANGDCNFQSGTIIEQKRITQSGNNFVTFKNDHPKHTIGVHKVGIHAYYCQNNDPTGQCQGAAVDSEEVTIGGGTATAKRYYQFLLSSDGKTGWQRTCDSSTGSPHALNCSFGAGIDFSNYLGHTGGFGSIDTVRVSPRKFYQFLIAKDGKTGWQRTCDQSADSPHGMNCDYGAPFGLSGIAGHTGGFASVDTTAVPGGKFHQLLISLDGRTAWQRTCDAPSGSPHGMNCAFESGFSLNGWAGHNGGFSKIDTTSIGNNRFYQFLISRDGKTGWQRTCDSSTGSPKDIPSSCSWGAGLSLDGVVSGYSAGFSTIDTTEVPTAATSFLMNVSSKLMSYLPAANLLTQGKNIINNLSTVKEVQAATAGCGDGPSCSGPGKGYCSCSVTCSDGSVQWGGFCYPSQTAAANCDARAKCPAPTTIPTATTVPVATATIAVSPTVVPSGAATATPVASGTISPTQAASGGTSGDRPPAGTTITHFKISETNDDAIWVNITENEYKTTGSNKVSYTFQARTGVADPYPREDRTVFVQFISKSAGGVVTWKGVQQATILLAIPPKITTAICDPSGTGSGMTITIKGEHFGTVGNKIKIGQQDATVAAGSWTNTQVVANITNVLAGSNDVTLTTPEDKSVTAACTIGKSQVDFKAIASCKTVDKPLSAADVEIKERNAPAGTGVAFPLKRVTFNAEGRPQSVLPELVEGKEYTIYVQPVGGLKKAINFTHQKGTSVLEAQNIPIGDIFPARGDCTINSLDRSELMRQWSSAKDQANRTADFNQDSRVNSLDYSCLISNFNKSCDR